MDLYPIDLGGERYLRLMRRRTQMHVRRALGKFPPDRGDTGAADFDTPRTRRGPLGRFWTSGLGLDPNTEARAATILGEARGGASVRGAAAAWGVVASLLLLPLSLSTLGGDAMIATLLGWTWAFSVTGLYCLYPRGTLHRLHHTPLTPGEVEILLGVAGNRVERAYLNLVLDVLKQPVPSSSARDGLRTALRALGDAVSGLPPEAFAGGRDAAALRNEAADLRAAADQEDDPILAGSLRRRADALDRRAGLRAPGSSPGFALRRAAALRQEVRDHVETLRAALPAFATGDLGAGERVAALSDAVRRVAVDAASVAQARAELDEEALRAALPATPAVTPQPQQEQPATLRQWWRG